MAKPPSSSSSPVLHQRASSAPARNLVIFASDHIGLDLKNALIRFLQTAPAGEGWDIADMGPHTADRCDYPDYAKLVAEAVLDKKKPYERRLGILICGSGIGMSIAANKGQGIRCALCHDQYTAEMARRHNDANILALGARTTGADVAGAMVATFLATSFDGEHHSARLGKLHALEGCRYSM
ncbi:hypothetical protein HDU86_003887 [Geranomyces michiganensis]|nr:hypothetical protein HDU86_003887 [Geranomyces michiganensis]